MGFFFGISAAAVFGLSAVLNRIGMRTRPDDDGLFMTVTLNVLVLGVPLLFLGLPQMTTGGLAAFAAGGLAGTYLGRFTNLKAIRRVGPSRANAFLTSSPIVSALLGWLLLGETVTPLAAVGAALVLVGLRLVVGSRIATERVSVPSSGEQPETAPSAPDKSGYLWAALAPLFFGSAFVFRKLGMNAIPDVLVGAFFGALTALVAIVVVDVAKDRISMRIRDNFRSVPWWFVAAGLGTSAALILQFLAYFELPAWTVSLLQGTQAMWTLVWSFLFLRREERLSWRLAAGIILVVVGVSVITVQGTG